MDFGQFGTTEVVLIPNSSNDNWALLSFICHVAENQAIWRTLWACRFCLLRGEKHACSTAFGSDNTALYPGQRKFRAVCRQRIWLSRGTLVISYQGKVYVIRTGGGRGCIPFEVNWGSIQIVMMVTHSTLILNIFDVVRRHGKNVRGIIKQTLLLFERENFAPAPRILLVRKDNFENDTFAAIQEQAGFCLAYFSCGEGGLGSS